MSTIQSLRFSTETGFATLIKIHGVDHETRKI